MLQWTKTRLIQVEVTLAADTALKELHTYEPVTSPSNPITIFFDSSPAQVYTVHALYFLDKVGNLRFGSKDGSTFVAVANKFPAVCTPANIDSMAIISRFNYGYEQSFFKGSAVQQILEVLPGYTFVKVLGKFLPGWMMTGFYERILKEWEKSVSPAEGFHIPTERFLD